jgi:hypothetical protein
MFHSALSRIFLNIPTQLHRLINDFEQVGMPEIYIKMFFNFF